MTNDRRFVVLTFVGVLLAGSGLLLTMTAPPLFGELLANVGLLLVVFAVCKHERRTRTNPHDRMESVCARALPKSWMVTLLLANLLFWLDYGGAVPLRGAEVAAMLVGVLLLSAGIFRASYRRLA